MMTDWKNFITQMTLSAHLKDSQALSSQIDQLLKTLAWDKQDLISWYKARANIKVCRVDESHIVPAESYARHTIRCHTERVTYSKENEEPKSSLPFYTQSNKVVSFVQDPAQVSTNHHPVQRLPEGADYAQLIDISRAVKQEDITHTQVVPDLVQREKDKRERESALAKTREQRLADERDYKRRRKSYRTKSGRKKATELQRDLVDGYMNDLSILYDRR
ncbi:hypothetical protein BGW37DRAFT_504712 [Umbelopsis sp. PMI_123]|nr:hypothetical protein BGW37DRAFT_504712 [Umbelopsis sp. PMI_123]